MNTSQKGDSDSAPLLTEGAVKQDILPFPDSAVWQHRRPDDAESVYSPKPAAKRLPEDAPNILIVLIDDAGPALPSTFGGEVTTQTLDRIVSGGIAYNRFHTTAMCSPTRASLLTGRNHHRVGNGQIAEMANDWDGYSGRIPRSSALAAEVLKHYGYARRRGANGTTRQPRRRRPPDRSTTGRLVSASSTSTDFSLAKLRSTSHISCATLRSCAAEDRRGGYHLSEDLADDAIAWLRSHKALQPDKPFYMYWASGRDPWPTSGHKEWADKYKGKFDDGWDAYRERVFKRAKEKGWIPQNAQLTPRHPTMAAWADIPEDERPFQRRLMEVAAGFTEHVGRSGRPHSR